MESTEDPGMVQQWTSEEVAHQIARYLRVNNYSEKFMRNAIDGDELLHLSREDLAAMGVNAIGHLNKLSRWIECLNHQNMQVTTPHLSPAKAEDLHGETRPFITKDATNEAVGSPRFLAETKPSITRDATNEAVGAPRFLAETRPSITRDATNEAVGSPRFHPARKAEILDVILPGSHEEQGAAMNRSATKFEEALSSQTMELDLIQKFVVRGMEEQLREPKIKPEKAILSPVKVKEVMDFRVKEDGLKVQGMEDVSSLQEELRVAKNRACKYEEVLSAQTRELDSRVGSHNFVLSCMEEQLSDAKSKADMATMNLAEVKKVMDFQNKEYAMKVQGLVANIFSLQEELRVAKSRATKYEETLSAQTKEFESRVGSQDFVVSCLEEQLGDAKAKTEKANASLAELKKVMDFQTKEYGTKVQGLEATIFSLQEELDAAMNRATKHEDAVSSQPKELDAKVGPQKFVVSCTEEQLRGAKGKAEKASRSSMLLR